MIPGLAPAAGDVLVRSSLIVDKYLTLKKDPDLEGESVRADCTRGFEWIKLPMSTDNPFYDKIVDFSTASTNGQAKSAIVVQAKANYTIGAARTPINPVEPDANGTFDVDGRESFALVAQCEQGQMEWVDMGPYECESQVKKECDQIFYLRKFYLQ